MPDLDSTDPTLLRPGTSDVFVVNTEGESECRMRRLRFSTGKGVAYLTTVHGQGRSDKVFFRMNDGRVFFMEMDQNVYEIENAEGRPYRVTRIDDYGHERVRLYHRGGNSSVLTFDQIDRRRRRGGVHEVRTTEVPTWNSLYLWLSEI